MNSSLSEEVPCRLKPEEQGAAMGAGREAQQVMRLERGARRRGRGKRCGQSKQGLTGHGNEFGFHPNCNRNH